MEPSGMHSLNAAKQGSSNYSVLARTTQAAFQHSQQMLLHVTHGPGQDFFPALKFLCAIIFIREFETHGVQHAALFRFMVGRQVGSVDFHCACSAAECEVFLYRVRTDAS